MDFKDFKNGIWYYYGFFGAKSPEELMGTLKEKALPKMKEKYGKTLHEIYKPLGKKAELAVTDQQEPMAKVQQEQITEVQRQEEVRENPSSPMPTNNGHQEEVTLEHTSASVLKREEQPSITE